MSCESKTIILPIAEERFIKAKSDASFRSKYLSDALAWGQRTSLEQVTSLFNESDNHVLFLRMCGVI
jgi:hypothetical protein